MNVERGRGVKRRMLCKMWGPPGPACHVTLTLRLKRRASYLHSLLEFQFSEIMPASKPPSSISRDKSYSVWPGNYFQDLAACSSILGKRERGLGEDLTKEPQAKRPVGGPGDTDCDIPIPRLDRSGSDEDEDEDEDEPEGLLELDSKTRSTKGMLCALLPLRYLQASFHQMVLADRPGPNISNYHHHLRHMILTSLKLQMPVRPRL